MSAAISGFTLVAADFFSETKPITSFKGDDPFLQNYLRMFPTNPFGLFWVYPFVYEFREFGISWVAPIRWFTGEVVGFYCREVFGSKKGLIAKSGIQLWYGMEWIPYYEGQTVVITEGPRDRISVSRFYPWTISLLGSGFGGNRAEVFLSAVSSVLFLLDSDPTGRARSLEMHEEFLRVGIQSSIKYLPEGRDPGDYMGKRFIESEVLESLMPTA